MSKNYQPDARYRKQTESLSEAESDARYALQSDTYTKAEVDALIAAALGGVDFADVALLVPFDGADGSTTFTDVSDNAYAMTANGNAQIDTAVSQFGDASGEFDGTGDYLSFSTMPALLQFGTEDFTIEFSVNLDTTSPQAVIGNLRDNTGAGYWWVVLNSTFLGQHTVQFGNPVATARFGTTTLATGSFQHIAIVRSGGTVRCWVAGTEVGSGVSVGDLSGGSTTPAFLIGANEATSSSSFTNFIDGHIDNLRVTKSAVYTADFTPPTAPFPTA